MIRQLSNLLEDFESMERKHNIVMIVVHSLGNLDAFAKVARLKGCILSVCGGYKKKKKNGRCSGGQLHDE